MVGGSAGRSAAAALVALGWLVAAPTRAQDDRVQDDHAQDDSALDDRVQRGAAPADGPVATPRRAEPERPTEVAHLAADAPLTLRPGRGSRDFARAVLRVLRVRLDVEVSLGEDAHGALIEAVPEGHVGILIDGAAAQVVVAGPEAQVFRTNLELSGTVSERHRAVALAIESLRDAAIEGPPEGARPGRNYSLEDREVAWVYNEPRGGLFGELPEVTALGKPTVYLGFVGGLSTERLTPVLGPRLGMGLCLGEHCVVIEGDLPVVAEYSTACDGREIEYRAVNLSLRFQLRPLVFGDWAFAFDFGILTRFGLANLVGVDASRVTTNFGLRSGIEVAWRFAGPMEMVLELGVDAAISPAILTRTNRPPPGVPCPAIESIFVEDLLTTYGVLAVRLRP